MKKEFNLNFHNKFLIEIKDIKTKKIKEQRFAENIILDQMFEELVNFETYFHEIGFGTGTGIPTPERTSLFNLLGSKTASTNEVIKALPTTSITKKIELSPTEYVGETITEVGVISYYDNVVTHAMLTDSEGNPLSFTKSETEIVTIYATIYVTIDGVGVDVDINGSLLDYLCYDGNLSNTIVALQYPYTSAHEKYDSNAAIRTVDLPNKKVTLSTRFQTTDANFPITKLSTGWGFTFMVSDVIPNTWGNLTGFDMGVGNGVKKLFHLPFSILGDMDKFYIDGVEETDLTKTTQETINLSDLSLVEDWGPMGSYSDFVNQLITTPYSVLQYASYPSYLGVPCAPNKIWVDFVLEIPIAIDTSSLSATLIGAGSSGWGCKFQVGVSADLASEDMEYWQMKETVMEYNTQIWEVNLDFDEVVEGMKYIRMRVYRDGSGNSQDLRCILNDQYYSNSSIELTSAPPVDAILTADLSCGPIPKSSDYVLDVSMELNYGREV